MFAFRVAIAIASLIFAALVCWRCFSWYRRCKRPFLLICGLFAALACIWSGFVVFAALFRYDSVAMELQIAEWKNPDHTVEEVRPFVDASWNSLVLTGVELSFIVAAVSGIVAFAGHRIITRKTRRDEPQAVQNAPGD